MEISAGFQLSHLRIRIRAFFPEATDPQTDQLSSCINKTKPRKPYTCKSNCFPAPPPPLFFIWDIFFCHITFNLLLIFLSVLQQPQWPEDYIELNSGIFTFIHMLQFEEKELPQLFFQKMTEELASGSMLTMHSKLRGFMSMAFLLFQDWIAFSFLVS